MKPPAAAHPVELAQLPLLPLFDHVLLPGGFVRVVVPTSWRKSAALVQHLLAQQGEVMVAAVPYTGPGGRALPGEEEEAPEEEHLDLDRLHGCGTAARVLQLLRRTQVRGARCEGRKGLGAGGGWRCRTGSAVVRCGRCTRSAPAPVAAADGALMKIFLFTAASNPLSLNRIDPPCAAERRLGCDPGGAVPCAGARCHRVGASGGAGGCSGAAGLLGHSQVGRAGGKG